MKAYLALLFTGDYADPVTLKRWLLREGQEVQPDQELFTFTEGNQEKTFTSAAAGTFKAFLWKEEETLDPMAMVAVIQVDQKIADDCVSKGQGKVLSPEEAKGGMSYAEAASIRLPP